MDSVIIKIITTFFATLSVSVIFNAPKHQLLYCGLSGAIGRGVYSVMLNVNDSIILATFVGVIMVTIYSRLLAYKRKTPITVFLTSGILPFVPGAGVYYTMYYLLISNNYIAMYKGIETLRIAGTVAIAIIMVLSLPKKIFAVLTSAQD